MSSPRNHAEAIAAMKIKSIMQIIDADALKNPFDKSATAHTSSKKGRKYAATKTTPCGRI